MIELLLTLYRLKEEPRNGWLRRGIAHPESVADHSWGTALLCLLFGAAAGVDIDRSISIALVHDTAESITGDRPARFDSAGRRIPDAEKIAAERHAIDRLFPRGSEESKPLRALWQEYEGGRTEEARFVRDMNLVDMCLQALFYEADTLEGEREPVDRPRRGSLAEFFDTTAARLSTSIGNDLFERILGKYRARGGATGRSEERGN